MRSPAKLAAPGGYSLYEGIVETDCWFGPLFTNLRLTRTHKPVHLRADFPLLQVQPLPREAYAEQTLNATAIVPDMAGMSDEDWSAYRTTIVSRPRTPDRPFGAYAVAARKRRQRNAHSAVGQRAPRYSDVTPIDLKVWIARVSRPSATPPRIGPDLPASARVTAREQRD